METEKTVCCIISNKIFFRNTIYASFYYYFNGYLANHLVEIIHCLHKKNVVDLDKLRLPRAIRMVWVIRLVFSVIVFLYLPSCDIPVLLGLYNFFMGCSSIVGYVTCTHS